jgi:hypothetical protein
LFRQTHNVIKTAGLNCGYLNPEIYPLNQSMIDGKMSEHEMEREHGRALVKLREKAEGELVEMAQNVDSEARVG